MDELGFLNGIKGREKAMQSLTESLCGINSGSWHQAGVERVAKAIIPHFVELGFEHSLIPLPDIEKVNDQGDTQAVALELMHILTRRPDAPIQVLCTGHLDTVFPEDSSFQTTWVDGNHLRGPGTADMKGGLVVLIEALRAFEQSPLADQVGIKIALSPDEEVGSPSSGPVLTELAKSADIGMTYEPALEDGTLAGARKGSGNFALIATGKSTHAGREFFAGRNAITALCQAALKLEALSNEASGITVNIGRITGGGPVNVVPEKGVCHFNVRMNTTEQQDDLLHTIRTIIQETEASTGCSLELKGFFNRPPKVISPRQQRLFDLLKRCGDILNVPIHFRATGGCCEGNNLAAANLPNIDTLGVRGANIHSDLEYACLDSFVERAQLSALLLHRIASGGKEFLC